MTNENHDAKWLKERGWYQYYNPEYWVHPKTIEDPEVQDYTNYGLSLEKAIAFEESGAKPFPSVGQFQRAISALYQPGYKGE